MRNNHFRDNFRVTALASIFSLIGLSCSCRASFAQTAAIAPDTNLPVNTLVNFNNTDKTYTITGGTQVGTTQFHSFQDFSVPTGNTAHFDSVLQTTNVIGRVTGSNISNIDGTLKTNGSTNLYLINPNGIIFGADAKLDIAGSFSASTANSIKFSDDSEFSATNPQAPPLLQVSIPLGLQYGESKKGATIKSSGSLAAGQDLVLNADKLDLAGLTLGEPDLKPSERLRAGRDLMLEAKDSIKIENGFLRTDKTSVGNAANITINAGSLYLNNSSITANTFAKGDAGTINITVTDSIKFDNKSSAQSQVGSATVIGNAGAVNVSAKTLELLGGSSFASNTYGQGNSGNITINVSNSIKFDGASSAQSQVTPQAVGTAGNVNVSAKTLQLLGKSSLASNSSGKGDAGNVNVSAETLELLGGSNLISNTFGQGNAGNITISVSNSIKFDSKSSAQSQVAKTAEGNAGNVNIFTNTLELLGESFFASSTFGKGNAGNININATGKFEASGINSVVRSTVETGAVGNGGIVTINTGSLSVKDGAGLSASTSGEGYAGDVKIIAEGAVLLSGANSGVFSIVKPGVVVSGKGFGSIRIDAESLSILNGAKVSTSTSGIADVGNVDITVRGKVQVSGVNSGIFSKVESTGKSSETGTVSIKAGSLYVNDNAEISTNTSGKGNAGDININVTNSIKFDGNSDAISQVKAGAIGNAGEVKVFAETLELLGGSSLSTSTFGQGNAGKITVNITDSINFDGGSYASSQVNKGAVGDAGEVNVFAKTLELRGSSSLKASNFGEGNAGKITIKIADSIKFDGGSSASSQVEAQAAIGKAGEVNVFAKTLELLGNSSFSTSTFGKGNAGNININVVDSINFDGDSYARSQVVEQAAIGNAGEVNIVAKTLELRGHSFLSTSTFGKGNAGNITIDVADSIKFDGSSYAASQVT